MNLSRRRFIYSAALGLMVPYVRASSPIPFSFFKLDALFANAWSNLVISLGGPRPSQNTIRAIQTIYDGIVSAGLLSKMLSVNAIVPDSLVAARVPFIQAAGDQIWTNTSFVDADLTVDGLKGNGSTKLLDPGISPNAQIVPSSNFGMTIVSPDSAGSSTGVEFGSINNLNSDHDTYLGLNSVGNANVNSCGFGSGWNIQVAQAGNGYYSANRLTTTDLKLYFANQATPHAQIGSATTATGTALASAMYVFAVRNTNGGAPAAFTSKRLSFVAVTLGLTSAESASFYSLIAGLRNSLGGGNP